MDFAIVEKEPDRLDWRFYSSNVADFPWINSSTSWSTCYCILADPNDGCGVLCNGTFIAEIGGLSSDTNKRTQYAEVTYWLIDWLVDLCWLGLRIFWSLLKISFARKSRQMLPINSVLGCFWFVTRFLWRLENNLTVYATYALWLCFSQPERTWYRPVMTEVITALGIIGAIF